MTMPPSPFLSAVVPSAETAPASNDWNPEDAGAIESSVSPGALSCSLPDNGESDPSVMLDYAPGENHIHEIFHYARKLYDDDHRFVLDEEAFMEAIEPPPLFMQRVG